MLYNLPTKSLLHFFNNYKSAATRNVKSFFTPYSPFLLHVLQILKNFGYVYAYTLSPTRMYLKVYPRYNSRFLDFKLLLKRPVQFFNRKQISRFKMRGYHFIFIDPVAKSRHDMRLRSSIDFRTIIKPGYVFLYWLKSFAFNVSTNFFHNSK